MITTLLVAIMVTPYPHHTNVTPALATASAPTNTLWPLWPLVSSDILKFMKISREKSWWDLKLQANIFSIPVDLDTNPIWFKSKWSPPWQVWWQALLSVKFPGLKMTNMRYAHHSRCGGNKLIDKLWLFFEPPAPSYFRTWPRPRPGWLTHFKFLICF